MASSANTSPLNSHAHSNNRQSQYQQDGNALNNHKMNSSLGTLRPEDNLVPEVRFMDDDTAGVGSGGGGGGAIARDAGGSSKSKGKLGHRRIDKLGEVSYKRVPTNALMGAIQLGIANSIGSLANKDRRDILMQDFDYIENVYFPGEGSQTPHTPPHAYGDFRFKIYAPIAFRYFRELFNIKPADFLNSLCSQPLRELSNPGASGSIFYVSNDDRFIIKTIQHKEAEFLRTLLPAYYLNLHQNPRTLLPKFFGLFCYQSLGKNIRLLVMNNLLPTSVHMHLKFDLKGSTYKRYASKEEKAKPNPTLKDLDFNEMFKTGILFDSNTYDALMNVIEKDCLVLQSFKIMDYSLLMGIHNIDSELNANSVEQGEGEGDDEGSEGGAGETSGLAPQDEDPDLDESQLTVQTEAWKSLQLDFNTTRGPYEEGGLPARNAKGERLLIFLGIIDILQSYRLFKKLEHTWKSVLHDGDSISVTNPQFYATRFQSYIHDKVFCKAVAMKQAPTRQQSRTRHLTDTQAQQQDEPNTSRHEAEVMLTSRGVESRRSYHNKSTNPATSAMDPEKRKKKERLFATNIEISPPE